MVKEVGICVSDIQINDYLAGSLSENDRKVLEEHLTQCKECLEKMVFAYRVVEECQNEKKGAKPMKSSWTNNLWLAGAILAFALSFFIPRYFIQLLVATILLGVKWIFDSVNARILIMIYDAWKHGGEKGAGQVLRTFGDRMR
jgi:hypothetical protein